MSKYCFIISLSAAGACLKNTWWTSWTGFKFHQPIQQLRSALGTTPNDYISLCNFVFVVLRKSHFLCNFTTAYSVARAQIEIWRPPPPYSEYEMLLYKGLLFLKDGGGDGYPYSWVIMANCHDIFQFLIRDWETPRTCILCWLNQNITAIPFLKTVSGHYVKLDLKHPQLCFKDMTAHPCELNGFGFFFFLLAASSFDCCLRYTKSIIPSKAIVGFTEQLADEACDINAVM